MKTKLFAGALALTLAACAPAMAACTSTFELGDLSAPSSSFLRGSFDAVQHFDDCYNFTLEEPADISGLVLSVGASLGAITLSSLALPQSMIDLSPSAFAFDDLPGGVYQLVVSGDVTGHNGGSVESFAGYGGIFVTLSSVPEPATWAVMIAGLALAGSALRRRRTLEG